jgi:hypothetical protein
VKAVNVALLCITGNITYQNSSFVMQECNSFVSLSLTIREIQCTLCRNPGREPSSRLLELNLLFCEILEKLMIRLHRLQCLFLFCRAYPSDCVEHNQIRQNIWILSIQGCSLLESSLALWRVPQMQFRDCLTDQRLN